MEVTQDHVLEAILDHVLEVTQDQGLQLDQDHLLVQGHHQNHDQDQGRSLGPLQGRYLLMEETEEGNYKLSIFHNWGDIWYLIIPIHSLSSRHLCYYLGVYNN